MVRLHGSAGYDYLTGALFAPGASDSFVDWGVGMLARRYELTKAQLLDPTQAALVGPRRHAIAHARADLAAWPEREAARLAVEAAGATGDGVLEVRSGV
jgi:hypothetical protein